MTAEHYIPQTLQTWSDPVVGSCEVCVCMIACFLRDGRSVWIECGQEESEVMWPSTRALHLTHLSEHTHTPWTHTRSSGQPMLRRPGSSWGFGALLKGTSVVVLRVERTLVIHSPPPPTIPAGPETRTRDLWVTSPTLSIRPILPPFSFTRDAR